MSTDCRDVTARRNKALAITLAYFREVGGQHVTALPPQFLEMAALIDGFLSGAIAPRYALMTPPPANDDQQEGGPPENAFTFLRAVVSHVPSSADIAMVEQLENSHEREKEAINQAWAKKEKEWARECRDSLTNALDHYQTSLKEARAHAEKKRRVLMAMLCVAVVVAVMLGAVLCWGWV